MPFWHRAGQLPERADPAGAPATGLRWLPAVDRASVGQSEPKHLSLGASLLPGSPGQRPEPRLRPAVSGPEMVEDPLAHVAGPNLLRSRTASKKPAGSWLMGAPNHQPQEHLIPVNNSYEKTICNPENISPRPSPPPKRGGREGEGLARLAGITAMVAPCLFHGP